MPKTQPANREFLIPRRKMPYTCCRARSNPLERNPYNCKAGEPAISDDSHPQIQILEADDGFRLQAFRSFLYFEFHSLSLVEGFITLRLDRAVVHEDVLTALTLNEPITLAGVKPLDGSLFSSQLLTPYWEELFALVVASRGLVAQNRFRA